MDETRGEQLDAYQRLLKVMDGSRLIKNMPLRDKNLIKSKYMHASAEEISGAIEEIKGQDERFETEENSSQEQLKKSMGELEGVVDKAEKYMAAAGK